MFVALFASNKSRIFTDCIPCRERAQDNGFEQYCVVNGRWDGHTGDKTIELPCSCQKYSMGRLKRATSGLRVHCSTAAASLHDFDGGLKRHRNY